jgi:hypothetical protein
VIADNGFRPWIDGFGFENYGNDAGPENMTPANMSTSSAAGLRERRPGELRADADGGEVDGGRERADGRRPLAWAFP